MRSDTGIWLAAFGFEETLYPEPLTANATLDQRSHESTFRLVIVQYAGLTDPSLRRDSLEREMSRALAHDNPLGGVQ